MIDSYHWIGCVWGRSKRCESCCEESVRFGFLGSTVAVCHTSRCRESMGGWVCPCPYLCPRLCVELGESRDLEPSKPSDSRRSPSILRGLLWSVLDGGTFEGSVERTRSSWPEGDERLGGLARCYESVTSQEGHPLESRARLERRTASKGSWCSQDHPGDRRSPSETLQEAEGRSHHSSDCRALIGLHILTGICQSCGLPHGTLRAVCWLLRAVCWLLRAVCWLLGLCAEGSLRDLCVCPFIHLHCILSVMLSVHLLFIVRIATTLALLSSMDGWMDVIRPYSFQKDVWSPVSCHAMQCNAMQWHGILSYITLRKSSGVQRSVVEWSIA